MSARQGDWCTELPATLDAIEQFCAEFRLWRARECPALNAFSAELLLREALTNSVIHGYAGNPRGRIWCALRAKRGRIVIAIREAGRGFDWRAVWRQSPEVSDTTGRGMEIFRRYASAVRFSSAGNEVILVKRF